MSDMWFGVALRTDIKKACFIKNELHVQKTITISGSIVNIIVERSLWPFKWDEIDLKF